MGIESTGFGNTQNFNNIGTNRSLQSGDISKSLQKLDSFNPFGNYGGFQHPLGGMGFGNHGNWQNPFGGFGGMGGFQNPMVSMLRQLLPLLLSSMMRPPIPTYNPIQGNNILWHRPVDQNGHIISDNNNIDPNNQNDFQVMKPAIYLYPEETTEVTVTLDPNLDISIDIPRYTNKHGWKCIAEPDGSLTDLQPKLTKLSDFENFDVFGCEYVYEAVRNNQYPYLYWEGNLPAGYYDFDKEGSIVESKDIYSFLNNALDKMQFNEKEKFDFLSYWVPKTLTKKSPYYKLSFIFTEAFDEYHPMNIVPAPNSIFRVLLSVLPLDRAPDTKIPSQEIPSFNRKGFSVLEWGGYFEELTSEKESYLYENNFASI